LSQKLSPMEPQISAYCYITFTYIYHLIIILKYLTLILTHTNLAPGDPINDMYGLWQFMGWFLTTNSHVHFWGESAHRTPGAGWKLGSFFPGSKCNPIPREY
jgi:hypothetical protein